ncbi:uncharacterized protein BYT42DRAFT_643300 [Radiomyces spectabilis]|uniref:uncharacterized protein n=1 Tax=Radiomyces spectabilis TaxID=64574 RepID=UPI00221FFDE7|nr:uncharacterized protein BYT42DRAFT_643300 [Radiomyces spectabilis]KAI8384497.1 hypothetical protein BYT42DRAFT_643300 [Radiomyces spectabilis]
MKFCTVLIALAFFVASCWAACNCDASDYKCVSQCVVEANACVSDCKGDTVCYENCIDNKWPTPAKVQKEMLGPTSAASSATSMATNSNAASSSFSSASASSSSSVKPSNAHGNAGSSLSSTSGMTFFIALVTGSWLWLSN